MAEMSYVCLYKHYLQTLQPFTDAERGRILTAMLTYVEAGEVPEFVGNERFIWPTIKAQIDRDLASYGEKCNKNKENGAKGGRPKNQTDILEAEKTERFFEKPKKANKSKSKSKSKSRSKSESIKSIEGDSDESPPPSPAEKPFFEKHGEYGWVKLTSDQYSRLLADFGEEELNRCIRYVDESAQSTGNKNKWKDWNLVIRKCHREAWGVRKYEKPTKQSLMQPSMQLGTAELDAIRKVMEQNG